MPMLIDAGKRSLIDEQFLVDAGGRVLRDNQAANPMRPSRHRAEAEAAT